MWFSFNGGGCAKFVVFLIVVLIALVIFT